MQNVWLREVYIEQRRFKHYARLWWNAPAGGVTVIPSVARGDVRKVFIIHASFQTADT